MIRISVYHWLPVSDNMLPEIERALTEAASEVARDVAVDQDAVDYTAAFSFCRDGRALSCFPIRGKINQRGFSQHVLNLAPIPGVSLGTMLDEIIPALRDFLADLLFTVAPIAIRNKLAVMHEGVATFQQFHSSVFESRIEDSAKLFLRRCNLTAVMLDAGQSESLDAGFSVPAVQIEVPPCSAPARTIANPDGTCILFYSTKYHPDELSLLDGIIYKFAGLATYLLFVSRVIAILKQTRDHVIPLRRQLAITLQSNTEEHFLLLTQMKKYLTYVNIKLPVVQKVLNHLHDTRYSDEFAAKLATFDEPSKVYAYPAIRAIETPRLQPHQLIAEIEQDSKRLQALYEEDWKEINVLSNELSQVLDGSLLSESIQIWNRELDAVRASVELDRGWNNRAKVLKVLTVILSANLGIFIADDLNVTSPVKFALAAVVALGAWFATEFAIQRRAAYYRMVIPLNATLPRASLDRLTASRRLKRSESNGTRRILTWSENLKVDGHSGEQEARPPAFGDAGPPSTRRREFDVTVDYERRGFLHSITLETEYHRESLDAMSLVEQLFERLAAAGCLASGEQAETSLLAQALTHLGVSLDADLFALNGILAMPAGELAQLLEDSPNGGSDASLSTEDRRLGDDILARRDHYLQWFVELQQDPRREKLLKLLGRSNVQRKVEVIRLMEAHHA